MVIAVDIVQWTNGGHTDQKRMCESHHELMGMNFRTLLRERYFPLRARRDPGNEAEDIGYLVGKNMFKVIKSLHSSE